MKTLIKITAICAFMFFSFSSQAQVQFGVKAGLNIANQKYSADEGGSMSPDSKIGFHFGVISEIGLGDVLAFQPGVLFSQKGFKFGDATISTNYIDIPLNLMAKFEVGEMKVYGLAGPNIAYGIGGKYKIEDEDGDYNFGSSEDDDAKPLDFGLNIGAGVQFSSFQIEAKYTLGLANLSTIDGITMKNNVIGFSVAYLFGGK